MGDRISKSRNQNNYVLSSTSSSDSESEDGKYDDVSLGNSDSGGVNGNPRVRGTSGLKGESEANSTNHLPVLGSRASSSLPMSEAAHRHGASKGGKHRQLPLSTSTQPEFQKSTDQRRYTIQAFNALIAAAANNDFQTASKLIDSGVEIDRPDIDGLTPLHHAASNGHIGIAALLVRQGAYNQATTPTGYTPLALAASRGHGAMVEYLLHQQYSSTLPDKNRDGLDRQATPVSTASPSQTTPNKSITPDLFNSMAAERLSLGEAENVDALVAAVRNNSLAGVARMIAALSKTNASGSVIPNCTHVDETDVKGRSLLSIACLSRQPDIALLLLCAGASIDQCDRNGYTPLMHAVNINQPRLVALLLRAGAKWSLTNKSGVSALTIAIERADLTVLQALVNGRVDIWTATAWNEPLIVYAARSNKIDIAKALLQVGADLPDDSGSRALARLARAGEQKVVHAFLKAGADPNHRAADGHTAFTLAAANGHEAVLSVLLKWRAPVGWKLDLQAQTDNQGRTALMLAALNKKDQTVEFLLNNHALPHQRDCMGRTAVLWAAAHATSAMMGILINHGATHVCTDHHGNTIFTLAADNDNDDVMRVICTPFYKNSQFDINTPDKAGDTALIKAARRGFKSMVELLLKHGANPLYTNKAGRTAILEAGHHGRAEVVSCLQQAISVMPHVFPYANHTLNILASLPLMSNILPRRVPVRTSELDGSGNSLMMLAAANGQHDFLAELLRPRFDGEGRDDEETAVVGHSDSESFSLDANRSLVLLNGTGRIDIDEKNADGMTALCLATREGHYEAIRLLIDNGAKTNGILPTQAGNRQELITPLWLASKLDKCAPAKGTGDPTGQLYNSPEFVVQLLLKNGASSDINTPSWQQQTPLIAAAGAGRVAVVNLLIDHGARIDTPDFHGLTPLMHAAWHGHRDIVEVLLNHGAGHGVKRGELSALILAAEAGHEYVIELLARRGANIDQTDPSGTTPLIGAAKQGKASAVRRLIALGANLHLADERKKTALDYAGRAGHDEIVGMLQGGSPKARDK